ncbi:SDR family NAD(P)-dependent oxidoreductase [Pseudarthrobacter sulfonivorans]|uniref:SDR family NAD(P)-dependent oxidoreductase n=1 Tax=Pseudarthrobacter sulfonivorans TaxID=121292 RepID=UPI00168AF375|nr:SDR family NAD(P)-dependent oxidoreductase [Pseudarthrobacter sulfonivorans]
MARIFITGSTDGLGLATAQSLLDGGHHVIVHARSAGRLGALQELADRGAATVVGDLSDTAQTRDIADQVNRSGPVDAVIHNAGVLSGPDIFQVNVAAPYLLTVLIHRPRRLIYLSSGMHRGGHAGSFRDGAGAGGAPRVSYSDSKLYVTALAAAVARLWPEVLSNAVDPGWVPTKMGGPGAPDDLRLGHVTQEWLATSDDPEALTSGGYWHHQRRDKAHPAALDQHLQDELLDYLARLTGERLT